MVKGLNLHPHFCKAAYDHGYCEGKRSLNSPNRQNYHKTIFLLNLIFIALNTDSLEELRSLVLIILPRHESWTWVTKYLRSCRQRSSSSAALAVWGPPRCRSADCACSCARWPWTCSKSQPGTSLRSVPVAPPCTWCSPHPGWWSSSPDQTPHRRAEKERKKNGMRKRTAFRRQKRRLFENCKEEEI